MGEVTADADASLEIAVIGGGIAGIALAIGLLGQGVKVKVYEQSRGFREIGAGIAFTASAVRTMELIDPALGIALRSSGSVSVSGGNKEDQNDYLRWLDGYNSTRADDPFFERKLCDLDAGYRGFYGCRRDQYLEAAGKTLPDGVMEFGKRLDCVEERGEDQRIRLTFTDGTSADVDAVVGCDGIKSRVREVLFGKDNPASYPHYTHFVAFRGLVPMEKAIDALGTFKATNFHHHIGPDSHITHYPVANNTMLNVTGFVLDPNEWPDVNNMVAPGSRDALVEAFAGWNPSVLALLNLLPEEPIKWAVFDTWDYPAPYYNRGKIVVAGDAAHASSPHHGGGAGIGIEDVLALSTVLGQVMETIRVRPDVKGRAVSAAFGVYDAVRRTRSQWLVNSSRRVCDLYHLHEWADPAKWIKAQTCFEEIKDRSHKLWNFDSQAMVDESIQGYKRKLEDILETQQNGSIG